MQDTQLITTMFAVFGAALTGGLIAKRLKLPAILGYITVGIVVGNALPRFIDRSIIELLAESGVTLLLFTLGLEFSFHRLRKVLGTVTWAAAVQILVTTVVMLTLFIAVGMPFLPAMYFAVAASLSSTAVVVKLLSERGELDTVPGEVATGWLVVQDLAVIPIMMVLPAVTGVYIEGSSSIAATAGVIGINTLKSALAIGLIVFLGKKGLPRLFSRVAAIGSREILIIATVGIVFTAGLVAYLAGLSAALGAFIAGLMIAETSQNHAIFSEIRPLRDLFAVVFFVSLGMALPVSYLVPVIPALLGYGIAIVVVKAAAVYLLSRFLGYHRKTAFLVGIALVQMSEFGFIIAHEGLKLGALGQAQYVELVALAFLTIVASAPLISRGQSLYYSFRRTLGRFWPKLIADKTETSTPEEGLPIRDHIVICGYGRVGRYVGRALEMAGIPFLVVDYNQSVISECRKRGIRVLYGDPADMDVLDYAQVDLARGLVIAIPDRHTQELVIGNAFTLNKKIRILCRTHHEEDQPRLKTLGVATIVQPEFEAALSITSRLYADFGVPAEEIPGRIHRLKIEHGLV